MTPRERARGLFRIERVTGSRWDVWHASGRCVGAFWTEEAAKKAVEEEAAPIAAAIESALAEQAAGEAERVREAVARERERWTALGDALAASCANALGTFATYSEALDAWRTARATSPAPEAAPAPCPRCATSTEMMHAALAEGSRLRDVIRTGGAMYRAERAILGVPGGVDPAPAPVAAERAVLLALVERAAKLGQLTLWHGDDCPHRYCDNCDADRDDDCAARESDECECSTWEIARLACDARDALAAARKGGG